jgi:hypothetical protein
MTRSDSCTMWSARALSLPHPPQASLDSLWLVGGKEKHRQGHTQTCLLVLDVACDLTSLLLALAGNEQGQRKEHVTAEALQVSESGVKTFAHGAQWVVALWREFGVLYIRRMAQGAMRKGCGEWCEVSGVPWDSSGALPLHPLALQAEREGASATHSDTHTTVIMNNTAACCSWCQWCVCLRAHVSMMCGVYKFAKVSSH